ncbi:hypothetical protein [Gulosibacter hominis]|nr:hypothetical protein [Gulosibacter hominis]
MQVIASLVKSTMSTKDTALLPGDDRFYVWGHELRETEAIELLFDE